MVKKEILQRKARVCVQKKKPNWEKNLAQSFYDCVCVCVQVCECVFSLAHIFFISFSCVFVCAKVHLLLQKICTMYSRKLMLFSCRFSFTNSLSCSARLFCSAQTITIGKRKRLPLQTHDVWNWLCVFRIAFRLYAIIFVRILQNKKRGECCMMWFVSRFFVFAKFFSSFSLQKWRAEEKKC